MQALLICTLLISLPISSASAPIFLISASLSPGSYYNHFCELTVSVVSNQLQSYLQIFNLIANQNVLFWDQENVFYPKAIDWRWDITFPDQTCVFKRSSTFYCAQIYTLNDGRNFTFMDVYNSTLNNYTFRVSKVQCPAMSSQLPMSIYVQVPINYTFYKSLSARPSPIPSQPSTSYLSNLTFLHTELIKIDTSALKYLQASITIRPQKYYLVGCKFQYSIIVTFNDAKYASQWQQIQIAFSNIDAINLDLSNCGTCSLADGTLTLNNTNFVQNIKSFIPPQYTISNGAFSIIANISLSFPSSGFTGISVSVLSSSKNLSENVTIGNPSLYVYEMASLKTQIYGQPSDAIGLLPSNITAGTCIETVTNTALFYGIGWIVGLIVLSLILVFCRKKLFCVEKYLYLAIILIEIVFKIVYLSLEKTNYYKTVALSCFVTQIVLNLLYFLQYAFLLKISKEMFKTISKHYSLVLSIILIFINYKSYTIVVQKLIEHKKANVRYSNDSIYLTHCFHLGLSMLIVFVEICLMIGSLVSMSNALRVSFVLFLMFTFLVMSIALKINAISLKFRKLKKKIKNILAESGKCENNE